MSPGTRGIGRGRTCILETDLATADGSADESLGLLGGFEVVIAALGEQVLLVGAPDVMRTLPGCPSRHAVFLTSQAYRP